MLLPFFGESSECESMGKWLKIILGTLGSSVRKQRELALENLALRQQPATVIR